VSAKYGLDKEIGLPLAYVMRSIADTDDREIISVSTASFFGLMCAILSLAAHPLDLSFPWARQIQGDRLLSSNQRPSNSGHLSYKEVGATECEGHINEKGGVSYSRKKFLSEGLCKLLK